MSDWKPEQRRWELHRLLSGGRKVVASRQAQLWGCNERTVRRTLAYMRDEYNLPLEYDPIDTTWRYTRQVDEVPAVLVSSEDRRALLFSLQAAAQFEGTPVSGQIRRLYEALLATLPPERATRFERMMKCVRFTGPPVPVIKKEVWDVLLLCLEDHATMSITYTDGTHGRTTEREVDPYGLLMRDRRWHLVAYCHRAKDVLTFSPQRISRASCTDRWFAMPQGFMDQYLADNFDGWQSTGDKVKVVLRVAKDAPPYVQDRQWSRSETRRRDTQGNVIIEFQASALFAIEREVRAEGGYVEVLEPVGCRETLRRTV